MFITLYVISVHISRLNFGVIIYSFERVPVGLPKSSVSVALEFRKIYQHFISASDLPNSYEQKPADVSKVHWCGVIVFKCAHNETQQIHARMFRCLLPLSRIVRVDINL